MYEKSSVVRVNIIYWAKNAELLFLAICLKPAWLLHFRVIFQIVRKMNYADEGLSATSYNKRDNFKRMLEDCKLGKIDLIITKNVSRFSRNVVDCLGIARDLFGPNPLSEFTFKSKT